MDLELYRVRMLEGNNEFIIKVLQMNSDKCEGLIGRVLYETKRRPL